MLGLITGLAIIQEYNVKAPIVTFPYGITVPKVRITDMSGADQTDMVTAGWLEHPLYGSYYYPVETITELANVNGPREVKIPIVTS